MRRSSRSNTTFNVNWRERNTECSHVVKRSISMLVNSWPFEGCPFHTLSNIHASNEPLYIVLIVFSSDQPLTHEVINNDHLCTMWWSAGRWCPPRGDANNPACLTSDHRYHVEMAQRPWNRAWGTDLTFKCSILIEHLWDWIEQIPRNRPHTNPPKKLKRFFHQLFASCCCFMQRTKLRHWGCNGAKKPFSPNFKGTGVNPSQVTSILSFSFYDTCSVPLV